MKNIKIIAHRGYSKEYNENTEEAFLKAIELGADGLELDVQKTNDNVFVIIHDGSINRISNKKGKIRDFLWKDLKKVKIFKNERILSLDELLKIVPDNMLLDIELKGETITGESCIPLLKLLLKYVKKENILITSFHYELLYYFKKNKICIGLLTGGKLKRLGFFGMIKKVLSLKPDYLCMPINMIKYMNIILYYLLIIFLKSIGNKFIYWTVDKENEIRYIKNHAEYIITNELKMMIKLLKGNK